MQCLSRSINSNQTILSIVFGFIDNWIGLFSEKYFQFIWNQGSQFIV